MKLPLALLVLVFVPHYCIAIDGPVRRDHSLYDYYVLEHDPITGVALTEVLNALGVKLVEQVGQLNDHWLVSRSKRHKGRSFSQDHVLNTFRDLREMARPRRDVDLNARSEDKQAARRITSSIRHLSKQNLRQRTKRDDTLLRAPPPSIPDSADNQGTDSTTSTSRAIAERLGIVDPDFPSQWHLVNDEYPDHMLNVSLAWEMDITGKGVIASVIDDGLDFNSDDLAENFDADDSYDYNDHVPLPKPVLSDDHHGTRCAGQIAAARNDVCGLGIAYNAKIAGVRILSGPISDADEAAALNHGFQNVSIYSCSWGPPDDGRSLEGPEYIINKAVINGIQNGRGGKGSIFVFASGNGAAQGDQCNFDGYTNSIYSVTVAAIDHKWLHPYYSEPCAANMVVAPSSGSGKNIVTTDVGKNKCSRSHGGTSAAAPNAVGVFALALQVRPDLTWRDIQHLCVRTAKKVNADDPDWETLASGRLYSYKYGYGVLDAYAYVLAAQSWNLVKPQGWIEVQPIQLNGGNMTADGDMNGGELIGPGGVRSTTTVSDDMIQSNNFDKLEHINVRVWISHTMRGDVEVELVSPNGIKSILAGRRRYDQDANGFPGWTFMTLKHWDEDPRGNWTIRVSDQQSDDRKGYFIGWSLTLWGSVIDLDKAKPYVLLDKDLSFPPAVLEEEDGNDTTTNQTLSLPSASATKAYPKPTDHLPDDHDTAEGEANKPAFPGSDDDEKTATTTTAVATETSTPTYTADEGWFSDLSALIYDQKWIFGAIAAVILFGLSSCAYLIWRRRRSLKGRGQYSSVLGDVPMNGIGREEGSSLAGGRTKELYDAFGEVSDDDEVDEETYLRNDHSERTVPNNPSFPDDDEGTYPAPADLLYKDEPSVSDHT